MTENNLKDYFEGKIASDELSVDLKDSQKRTSYDVTIGHSITSMKTISRLILITSMLLFACSNKDDIDSFLKVEVQEFNQKIIEGRQNKQQWVETPYLIVNQLFGPRYNSEGHQTSYWNNTRTTTITH